MKTDKITQFYGNRGFVFDLTLSLIILIIIFLFTNKLELDYNINFITSIISFLGILGGFMLTAFSLLLLYNPKENESPKFYRLRHSKAFKYALKYFIFTILIILFSVSTLFLNLVSQNNITIHISIFLVILSFFMLARCLYYLFAIIDFE